MPLRMVLQSLPLSVVADMVFRSGVFHNKKLVLFFEGKGEKRKKNNREVAFGCL